MNRFLFCLILFSFSRFLFSQNSDVKTIDQVETSPLYKNCEAFKGNTNQAFGCISRNLNEELSEILWDLINREEFLKFKHLEANFSMVITKRGYFDQIQLESTNNDKFAQKVKIAILRVTNKINKNSPLEPAKLADGTPVDIHFKLPVTLKLQ
jgi:hypothetical protein